MSLAVGGWPQAGTEYAGRGGETCQRSELVGCGGELRVLVVGGFEVGCFSVAYELVDRRGAWNGHDIATADDPCQGDLGRRRAVRLGHRAQRVQQLVTTGEVLVEEQWVGEAD